VSLAGVKEEGTREQEKGSYEEGRRERKAMEKEKAMKDTKGMKGVKEERAVRCHEESREGKCAIGVKWK